MLVDSPCSLCYLEGLHNGPLHFETPPARLSHGTLSSQSEAQSLSSGGLVSALLGIAVAVSKVSQACKVKLLSAAPEQPSDLGTFKSSRMPAS